VANTKKSKGHKETTKWVLPLVFLLAAVLLFGIIYSASSGGIKKLIGQFNSSNTAQGDEFIVLRFIDVGQGDSTLIELPDGKIVLVDAGPALSSLVLEAYIDSLGHNRIDYLIATHPHEDHIGGMAAIITKYDIGEIWAPKVAHNTRTYELFLDAVKNKGLSLNTATAGKTIYSEADCSIKVLYPKNDTSTEDPNNWSVILLVEFGGVSILLTGDADSSFISSVYNKKIDVLKVSHHGSYRGTDIDLVRKLKPESAIISCATDNPHGFPHKEVLEALRDISVYRTDIHGTIVVISNGRDLKTEWGF